MRRNRHAEIDDTGSINRWIFQVAGFVADMETVFVAGVWLLRCRLHWDVLLLAVFQHLCSAREQISEFLHAPWGDDANARFQGFSGQLESTLVVPLAGCSMHKRFRANFTATLQAGFGDQRTSDAGAHEINVLIASLPLQYWERKVAAQLFTNVHKFRRLSSDIASLLHDSITVFAGLTEINVETVNVVTFILKPSNQY